MFLKYLTIGLSLFSAVSGSVIGGADTSAEIPRSDPPTVCAEDTQECWDGSVVTRISERGCVFARCPLKGDDEIVFCEDWMIETRKEQVEESRCIDDCDCISMFITSLSSLECVIPDSIMEVMENSREIYHHCKDEKTGESLIKPRQDLLLDTQDTCRRSDCEIHPEIINDFEEKDAAKRDEAERNYEVTDDGVMTTVINVEEGLKEKRQPVRDVDVIFEENTHTRDLIQKCLPDCDGTLDQSICEIAERVMTNNCTVVCDVDSREVEKEILTNCDMFGNEKESVDMLAEFSEFYSSGNMWSLGLGLGLVSA
jgi:hypothetical protein